MQRSQKASASGLLGAAGRWLLFIALIICLVTFGMHLFSQRIPVTDTSMYPTLQEGDWILPLQACYWLGRPKRGDIVLFNSHYNGETRMIRRVIALPGETVQILNGRVYVNGEPLEEPEERQLAQQSGLAGRQITLGEEEYFVLNDNRDDTSDSREPVVGNVRRSEILAKIALRVWPMNRFGIL